jgi:hypothetical protein
MSQLVEQERSEEAGKVRDEHEGRFQLGQ